MIDYSKEIIKELQAKTALKVYYEYDTNPNDPIPCITYCINNNSDNLIGDTINYSDISFTIKIWSKSKKNLEEYAPLVDKGMKNLGFKRTSTNELSYNHINQKIMIYEGIGYESII